MFIITINDQILGLDHTFIFPLLLKLATKYNKYEVLCQKIHVTVLKFDNMVSPKSNSYVHKFTQLFANILLHLNI